MAVTIIYRIILKYATIRLHSKTEYEAICEKRISLGSHLKRASMGFFSKKNQGDLISMLVDVYELLGLKKSAYELLGKICDPKNRKQLKLENEIMCTYIFKKNMDVL